MTKKDRLKKIIHYYSQDKPTLFAKQLGVAPSTISSWLARDTLDYDLIFSKCENLSPTWLLSGEGEMLLDDEQKKKQPKLIKGIPFITENLVKVKYLDIAATATFTEYESMSPEEYDYTYILPRPGEEFDENDIVFPVYGESMEPSIPNHAEVLGKFIRKSQWHWAKGVVLISYNNSFVIKRILENKLDSHNYLVLGSDNPDYPQKVKVSFDSIHVMFKADRIVSASIK